MKNGLNLDDDGNKLWYLNDELHRIDGPAIEWADGSKSWYLNGKLHREDGPAIKNVLTHCEAWYLNDRLHRIGGPAVKYTDGEKEWWLNDKKYSLEEYDIQTLNRTIKKNCFTNSRFEGIEL